MKKVTVLGAGTWGVALTILLANNGHEVTLWSKFPAETGALAADRSHIKNLPGAVLPDSVKLTNDLAEAAAGGTDLIVNTVISPFVREVSHALSSYIKEGTVIVNASKGIEHGTLYTMTDIISQEIPQAKVAVLSGPSHAEEVSRHIPTTVVAGASEKEVAMYIQDMFMNKYFRVYTSPDVLGIEIGGALKNVIALAAGIADGLGYGDNTKAALITRGIAEMSRIGLAMGGRMETFNGLSGIGDLIVTCASVHSRNRKAGYLMGQGKTMKEAMDEVKMVVEGVYSAKAAMGLARKYHVEIPIIEQVNAVLFEDKSAKEAVNELMLRDKKIENSLLPWE